MNKQGDQESLLIMRGLLILRVAMLAPFFPVILIATSCRPDATTGLVLFLLILAIAPLPIFFLHRSWVAHPTFPRALVLFDFLLVSLMSYVAVEYRGMPLFFPMYFALVSLEAACWWGWPGALISGAGGAAFLAWLYMGTGLLPADQGLLMIALVMAWPVVLGYFTQWALREWRERRRMATWLARQEGMVGQVQERLTSWQATCASLRKVTSVQGLGKTMLHEAVESTASTLGLVALRDPRSGVLRTECWEGFALPGSDKVSLQPREKLPAPQGGGLVEVRHVLEVPLRAVVSANGTSPDVGRIVVARQSERPYQEAEEQWLHIIASYTAALLENRTLRDQLGRVQEEASSIALAGWTLASLPDPAAAMEMACRNVLNALELQQMIIFLYSGQEEQGCRVVVYPAQGPARTVVLPLQGRGLRLLRRFVDGGTSVVVNRRGEWPDLFELMGWEREVEAVACFPLYVLERRWGALCLLAKVPDAFPAQTQENLAIFSGEVAMALENYYLRQSVRGAVV